MIVKPFFMLALLLCVGVYSSAQNTAADVPGLTVVKKKWHHDLRDPALDRDSNQETSDRQADELRRRDIEQTNDLLRAQGMPVRNAPEPRLSPDLNNNSERSAAYVYEVSLRNDGSKDVSSVTWEYVFFAPDSDKEVGRRRFTTKTSIGGGKTRTLTMRSAIPPTGTIDAAQAGKISTEKYSEKIVIVSVEYSDGSKWPTPPPSPNN